MSEPKQKTNLSRLITSVVKAKVQPFIMKIQSVKWGGKMQSEGQSLILRDEEIYLRDEREKGLTFFFFTNYKRQVKKLTWN